MGGELHIFVEKQRTFYQWDEGEKFVDLNAVQTPTLQETVYEEILKAIVSGKIVPGERITLGSLAQQLKVSNMPIREALRRLEAGNFVSIERNKRIVVKELSPENLKEILKLRLILETLAAKKATLKRSEESLNQLQILLHELIHAKDEEALLQANKEFHKVIYREAKMQILFEIINGLWERVSPYLHILLRNEKNWNRNVFIKNHEGMLEGIRQKDPKKVCKWLKNDLNEAAEIITKMLKEETKSRGR